MYLPCLDPKPGLHWQTWRRPIDVSSSCRLCGMTMPGTASSGATPVDWLGAEDHSALGRHPLLVLDAATADTPARAAAIGERTQANRAAGRCGWRLAANRSCTLRSHAHEPVGCAAHCLHGAVGQTHRYGNGTGLGPDPRRAPGPATGRRTRRDSGLRFGARRADATISADKQDGVRAAMADALAAQGAIRMAARCTPKSSRLLRRQALSLVLLPGALRFAHPWVFAPIDHR